MDDLAVEVKFRISRASTFAKDSLDNSPVPGAAAEVRVFTERRPWGQFVNAERLWQTFITEGRNHRQESRPGIGGVTLIDYVREDDILEWFIDIPDLDSLLALEKAVGNELIVSNTDSNCYPWHTVPRLSILIHDDYIE